MDFLLSMIDTTCLWYLYLTNSCRSLCDKFIDKNTFTVTNIHIHTNSGRKVVDSLISHNFQYKNIAEFLANHNMPWIAQQIVKEEDYWMEVIYYLGETRYRVIYNKWDQVQFPPYTLEEIKGSKSNIFQMEIIYADYNDQDITTLIREYAGPNGNFYSEKSWFINLERIIGSGAIKQVNDKPLLITDNSADDHIFHHKDRIKLA